MIELSAAATLPAEPDQSAGMRTEKSPRRTAARTWSVTLLSMPAPFLSPFLRWAPPLTADLVAMSLLPSLPTAVLPTAVFSLSQAAWYPEFDLGSGAGIALDAAPASGELRAFPHGDKSDVTRHAG